MQSFATVTTHCHSRHQGLPGGSASLLLWMKAALCAFYSRNQAVGMSFWRMVEDRRRQWHPTPVLLPGKSHGWRSLVGCSPWGHKELDTIEWLHFHSSLSCIGEGNGNPLQCSCLENPRDGGAWWAAVYGVAQSQTRLKRLSSSSSSRGQELGQKCAAASRSLSC